MRAELPTSHFFMLKNYVKIAFKVMLRRKFFTAVSLFGISFTIMTFTCVAAMFDLILGPNSPGIYRDRTLYVMGINKSTNENDPQFGRLSYNLLGKELYSLKTPESVSLNISDVTKFFKNGKSSLFGVQYVDATFWNIEKFKFLEGKPFNQKDIDENKKVVVVTRMVRDYHFGDNLSVGKFIKQQGESYRVVGVVEDVNMSIDVGPASMWYPLNPSIDEKKGDNLFGFYSGIILARSSSDFDRIKKELDYRLSKIQYSGKSKEDKITADVKSTMEFFKELTGQGIFHTMVILLFLFMLLPAVNLMTININRIYERNAEIGIRKAFGATSKALVYQFIIENIVLTFLGGLIGFLFCTLAADLFVDLINYYSPGLDFPRGQFKVNWRIIGYTLVGCIFFGLLSGIYPAWKMSKLHVVEGLKGGELC
jgi:putative ABC transport system permease protein